MDNQLTILISLYEEEKLRLEKCIKECLAESEFLFAHYHSNALHQITGRLRTLHNIGDKFYDDKQFSLWRIGVIENLMETTKYDVVKKNLAKEFAEVKDGLERLNASATKEPLQNQTSILDEVLTNLLDRKIKNLKLILKKSDNFFLAFTYSSRRLQVVIFHVKQLGKKWILSEERIETLKNLGFCLSENGSRLVLTLIGEKQEILKALKIILAKIVFELFYFKEFENESFIQFTEITRKFDLPITPLYLIYRYSKTRCRQAH